MKALALQCLLGPGCCTGTQEQLEGRVQRAAAPSSELGLQPMLCAPPWVPLARGKNLPAPVPWSACQLQVAILVGATGEGVSFLTVHCVSFSTG